MSILDEIKESYNNGNLIPFIGAGFPMNIGDFPDWNDFVDELSEDLELSSEKLRESFKGDNIRATEYYVYKKGKERALEYETNPSTSIILNYGKSELAQKLNSKFEKIIYKKDSTKSNEQWSVYKEFFSLNKFSTIYTTNWDRTLEDFNKLSQSREQYIQIIDGKKLREYLSKGNKRLLIKYHGDYKHHGTVIATQTDYFNRLMQRNILDIELQRDLLHYDFLFLGFSFEDIFIRYVLYQTTYLLEEVPSDCWPKIFLVSVGKPNDIVIEYHKLSHIESYNICEINSCPYIKEEKCKDFRNTDKCNLKTYFIKFFECLKNEEAK